MVDAPLLVSIMLEASGSFVDFEITCDPRDLLSPSDLMVVRLLKSAFKLSSYLPKIVSILLLRLVLL